MSLDPYLYVTPQFDRNGEVEQVQMAGMSERHPVQLQVRFADPSRALNCEPQPHLAGVVIELANGWPWPAHLRLAERWLQAGKRALFYWPAEGAVELADDQRVRSYWRLCLAVWAGTHVLGVLRRFRWLGQWVFRGLVASPAASPGASAVGSLEEVLEGLDALEGATSTANLEPKLMRRDGRWRVDGRGVYLRTDYWARISSGGSYGHTCHVANQLAAVSADFVCLMPQRFSLLDEMGLHQVVVRPPFEESSEDSLLKANEHLYIRLRTAVEALAPAYIYERAVLGNFVGARLAQEFGIPYLLEYNGSEISMSKSFGNGGYQREAEFLRIEAAAFRRAGVISVISEHVRNDLVGRGVDPAKILVNPNGVDLDRYQPPEPVEKQSVRQQLGFEPGDRVIGFTGTFGGWHGIDILAQALPRICERVPAARFLLIGDGHKKPLIDESINRHRLWDRVVSTGRVPQQEGARLLKACDLFVSPHSANMVDSPFFGSPTKVFEYMGMGAGIVASDLEQIGEVLAPGLRADALQNVASVEKQRAVLCRPGDLDQFVDAVVFLCEQPAIANALGRNARQAAETTYSWSHHVQRLLAHAAGQQAGGIAVSAAAMAVAPAQSPVPESGQVPLATGDRYKDEVQNQWDNDPCGSHYVKNVLPHTLEWFQEVERHRYQEYGPWMPELMEFSGHRGECLLEIGAGMGTDHAQFARHGAIVTDIDLSSGHLALAQENFKLRGLQGRFVHHDAETLPFESGSFDVVYSNGVIHHTPNTQQVIDEMFRVLRPGGKVIIMVYAENSLHYWRNLVAHIGLMQGQIYSRSIGHIMSESVEMSDNGAKPLVKVYTAPRLRQMFNSFEKIEIHKRQLTAPEMPRLLKWLPLQTAGKLMGWNLVLKAYKPR
jgi:glycosyltransferase involved in cell wall biosynthesis/ubiquinone/menaquinone biosynthesis C-methylase UbiE